MSRQKTQALRNLRRRPARPALGAGRVQRACRRALWALGEASTSAAIEWAYARRLLMGGERPGVYVGVASTRPGQVVQQHQEAWLDRRSEEVRPEFFPEGAAAGTT